MKTTALLAALLAATIASPAQAEAPGGEVLSYYYKENRIVATAYVRGYMEGWLGRGVVEGATVQTFGFDPTTYQERINGGGNMFCVGDLQPDQALALVMAYLARNPAEMKIGMGPLVWKALRESYPCKSPVKTTSTKENTL